MEVLNRWMRQAFFRLLTRVTGLDGIYRETVLDDSPTPLRPYLRARLRDLLTGADRDCPFFAGRFSAFLRETATVGDEAFFAAYAQLPVFTKQDYLSAGNSVLRRTIAGTPSGMGPAAPQSVEPNPAEFSTAPRDSADFGPGGCPATTEFRASPSLLRSIKMLKRPDFLLPMATGGTSRLPLTVPMTKRHAVAMFFTFFRCWRRMGWEPGDKVLVFYPKGTYNIDDLALWNRFEFLSGFRIELFDRLDEPTITGLVDGLNQFQPKLLLIFPSVMNHVATRIRTLNLPLRHRPALINVSGETFFDCQRQNIARVFPGSRIEDSYGSVELGEIAHETTKGLEIFSNVAYVENRPNREGRPELIITRLGLDDFPFIRYAMRDVARVDFEATAGRERFLLRDIEGKDENHLPCGASRRLYPSFFNRMVNVVNAVTGDPIVEVKVFERGPGRVEILYILREETAGERVRWETERFLRDGTSGELQAEIRFVPEIAHDYRLKNRVIDRGGDREYAGGILGQPGKGAVVPKQPVI